MKKLIFIGVLAISIFTIAFVLYKSETGKILTNNVQPKKEKKENRRCGYPSELAMWQYEQRAYPGKEIPEGWREEALNHIKKYNNSLSKVASSLSWTSVGPANIAGRIRAIVVDSVEPNVLYVGSVGGGVWKTTTGGANWFPLKDEMENLAVCALVMDPDDHNTLYAGTGEGFNNIDAIRGAGIFKTTDAGATWKQMANSVNGNFYYVNKLEYDKVNKVLWIATKNGLFKSTNGGGTYTQVISQSSCTDLEIAYTNPVSIYATFSSSSAGGSQIHVSPDAGQNFAYTTFSGYGRIELAVSKSEPLIAYCALADNATNQVGKMGITTNGGKTWTTTLKVAGPTSSGDVSYTAGQAWYNNILLVDPIYSKIVYAGGMEMFKTTTSGAAWTRKGSWYASTSSPQYVHADIHALAFDPRTSLTIYCGNDGGMFKSTNGGDSWTSINSGLAITQFYYGAVAGQANSTKYFGGTQDNGTIKTDGNAGAWYTIGGGDGGATEVDYNNPNIVYHEYISLQMSKSTTGGGNASLCMNGIPTASGKTGTTDRTEFISPFILDPNNSSILLAGTYRVYKTTNGAGLWKAISGDLSTNGSSNVSALGVARGNSNCIYVGYSNGVIQATTNNGETWTKGSGLPSAYCKRFVTDYKDTGTAYACYSGYVSGKKVFKTTNYGVNWVSISGDLPNIPINCIQINPADSKNIIVGTDLGIFVTVNGGTNWLKNNNGLANVRVEDLDYRISDNRLFAATHGRGMFMTEFNVLGVKTVNSAAPESFVLLQNYPNPFNPSTTIKYQIKTASNISLTVYDLNGKKVQELVNQYQNPGTYQATWNGKNSSGSKVASGVYHYSLKAGNTIQTKKMILMK